MEKYSHLYITWNCQFQISKYNFC